MNLNEALDLSLEAVGDARRGLPPEVFRFVSRLTPLVIVDLLVRSGESGRAGAFLLTWRDDEFYQGWHVPGGIIRFKERWQTRIEAVARTELGSHIEPNPTLLGVFELMAPTRDVRGHFISLLFECRLSAALDPALECRDTTAPRSGEWSWFERPPSNLLAQQYAYRSYMEVGAT